MTVRMFWMAVALAIPLACQAVPFWGAKESARADTPMDQLQPGEFIWEGQIEPSGPIVVIVSLPEQMAYVYRNGIQVGVTTISTGKEGHRTPTGIFTILQKDKHHHSSIYNNAAMPYTQRLTWGGVALHAGGLPGYPSSHGCVHLPTVFAEKLFEITQTGMTVVVADNATALDDVVHPPALAPVDPASGEHVDHADLGPGEKYEWHPELSISGPVSMVLSAADGEAVIFRNGIEIGRSKLMIRNPEFPLGTHAYMVMEDKSSNGEVTGVRWVAIGLPGYVDESKGEHDQNAMDRLSLPEGFVDVFRALLHPGVTVMITDAPVLEHTSGVKMTVVTADPQ